MMGRARQKALDLGLLNDSITAGTGAAAGYLGEEIVAAYLGAEIVSSGAGTAKYDHDLVLDGVRIEVKTKRRTVPPMPHYTVSIAETSLHQRPDVYVFVSLQFARSVKLETGTQYFGLQDAWLLGRKTPCDFLEQATKWNPGDVDQSNDFTAHVAMYNLPIEHLDEVSRQHVLVVS
jgi:hypothetical protein